jgi:hypothetical protein
MPLSSSIGIWTQGVAPRVEAIPTLAKPGTPRRPVEGPTVPHLAASHLPSRPPKSKEVRPGARNTS